MLQDVDVNILCTFQIFLCSVPEIWIFHHEKKQNCSKILINSPLDPPKMAQFFVNFLQALGHGWHFYVEWIFLRCMGLLLHVFEHTYSFFGYANFLVFSVWYHKWHQKYIVNTSKMRCEKNFLTMSECWHNFSGSQDSAKIVPQSWYISLHCH